MKTKLASILLSVQLAWNGAFAADLKQELEAFVTEKNLPGMVVLVEHQNQTVFHEAIGYSDIENQVAMDKQQQFRWFSMSKPVTSLAMVRTLSENGHNLETPLKTLYPNFDRDDHIPLNTVMNHTAGFGYGGEWDSFTGWLYWMFGPLERAHSLPELMSKLDGIPLLSEPGAEFRYSMSSDVLGAVVQRVNGHRFERYMQEKIFAPLNMQNAGFITKGQAQGHLAPFYRYDRENKQSVLVDDPYEWDKYVYSGGGGMTGTAADYNQFLRVLRNPGEYGEIADPIMIRAIVSNQLPEHIQAIPERLYPDTGFGFGLGVKLKDSEYLSQGSYYWAGLAGTIFWVDPEKDLSVVVMTQLLGARKPMEKSMIPMITEWFLSKGDL